MTWSKLGRVGMFIDLMSFVSWCVFLSCVFAIISMILRERGFAVLAHIMHLCQTSVDNVWSLFNVCIYCISVMSRWFRLPLKALTITAIITTATTTTQKSVSCWMCPPCNIYSTFHLVHAVLGVLVGPQKEVLTGNRPICFALPRHSGRVFVVLIKTFFFSPPLFRITILDV